MILVYKFEHGKLKSSHCRLKHTEISITPVALGCFKNLMTRYIDECLRNSVARKKNQEKDYEGMKSLLNLAKVHAQKAIALFFSQDDLTDNALYFVQLQFCSITLYTRLINYMN